jgi:predicted GIY-YIG superfamily endonuclease
MLNHLRRLPASMRFYATKSKGTQKQMTLKCGNRGCNSSRARGYGMCHSCLADIEHASAVVRRAARGKQDVYVGRTSDLEARREQHARSGRTEFTTILASRNVEKLLSLESEAIHASSYLYKLANRTTRSLGPVNRSRTNYLYVASTPKRGRKW